MTLEVAELHAQLPEISSIEDARLIRAIEATWADLFSQGSFPTLRDLPVLPGVEHPHMVHNRSVLRMALAIATILEEMHGVTVDRDHLIAAAVLQDASKLVEFEREPGGAVTYSRQGQRYRHGFLAAHVALSNGVPDDVVEAILDHTPDSPRFPRTLISKILLYVDQIDMAALDADRWKKVGVIFR